MLAKVYSSEESGEKFEAHFGQNGKVPLASVYLFDWMARGRQRGRGRKTAAPAGLLRMDPIHTN